jgi:CubicO group peptidase (beta-lactamase class C family)
MQVAKILTLLCGALLLPTLVAAQQKAAPPAANLDVPSERGIMVGFPPPADKFVTLQNQLSPAHMRWTLQNLPQLAPTVRILRGEGPIIPLQRGPRLDVDSLIVPDGNSAAIEMREYYRRSGVDALVVLHRGKIVFERYFGDMTAQTQHAAFSATKSLIGLMVRELVHEGRIDAAAAASKYVPELAGTGVGTATIQQLLDMTASFQFFDKPRQPGEVDTRYLQALGFLPRSADPAGPEGVYELLLSSKPYGDHGTQFRYDNGNTDTLGWVLRRVTNRSIQQLLGERVWQKLGMEQDGTMILDSRKTEWAAGGVLVSARDFARIGEMVRLEGRYDGRQVLPAAVFRDLRTGGDRRAFAAGTSIIPGGSYHDQWWFYHDRHDSYAARGQFGQRLWIAPNAETVIVQFSTDPDASNAQEPLRLAAWQAIADRLAERKH